MKRGDLGIAVIGAGRIGTLRARLAAKHPAVGFLAIADRDPARARALADAAGADLHSGDNDAMIADPRVTAVIVSTPEQEHVAPVCTARRFPRAYDAACRSFRATVPRVVELWIRTYSGPAAGAGK
jgi:glutamyl-tRNA reductase